MAQRRFQFYDPRLARLRNQQGTLKSNMEQAEDSLTHESSKFRTNKKMYSRRVNEIQSEMIFGDGKSHLPGVSDLILNISDIEGANTNSYKPEVLRHRMVAKMMRENRLKEKKEQEGDGGNQAFRIKPSKNNYHLTPVNKINNDQEHSNPGEKRGYVHQESLTVPSNRFEPSRKQERIFLPILDITQNQADSTQRPNGSERRIPHLDGLKTEQHTPFKKRQTSTLQISDIKSRDRPNYHLNPQYNIFNVKNTLPNRSLELQKVPYPAKQQLSSNHSKSNQYSADSPFKPKVPSRINPTFLSYGSQYLTLNKNYLASYGRNVIN